MSSSSRAVLVTGCAGFIGSHLAERLVAENYHVVGIDCFTPAYPRERKEAHLLDLRAQKNFHFVEGDLRRLDLPSLLRERNIGTIFHVAGQASVRPSWGDHFDDYVQRNIVATQHLLEAVKAFSIDRFVFSSSSSVYGDAERFPTDELVLPRPVSPYGVTKLAAEHLTFLYARQYGVPAVALRYFSVYGPRQRPDMAFSLFINAMMDNRPITILGDGQQSRDFTYVGDVVQANLLAMRSNPDSIGRIYNIGGGSRVTLAATLELLSDIMQVQPQIEYKPAAAGDQRHTSADTTRARNEIGFDPRVKLEEGLRRQVEWYLHYPPGGRP
ncbi:MAG TPA: NAD-dependent epimerase/dehydratase family protein [Anaerolineae bacterium]